jgi:hypothetical protein
MKQQSKNFYINSIQGARNWSNILLAIFLSLGSLGFLGIGIISYLKAHNLDSMNLNTLPFIPQGVVMCFYGIAGIFMGGYLWWTVFFNVGSGYNEIDLDQGMILLFRWGFPGKNRKIRVRCLIRDIESIRITSQSALGRLDTIALCIQGATELPFDSIFNAGNTDIIEQEAAQLAQYLQVPLETRE